jgi:hypothetical protein
LSEELPAEEDHRAWLPFLIRKRRFAEAMILKWQVVEGMVDQMVIDEFDLIYSPKRLDPRVDLVRESSSFPRKVAFLVDMGRLSKGDQEILIKFSEERNNLFHGFVYKSTHPVSAPETEKTRLMELARRAALVASNRAWGVWTDQESGDTGNLDTSKPERPRGADFADKERNRRILSNQGQVE